MIRHVIRLDGTSHVAPPIHGDEGGRRRQNEAREAQRVNQDWRHCVAHGALVHGLYGDLHPGDSVCSDEVGGAAELDILIKYGAVTVNDERPYPPDVERDRPPVLEVVLTQPEREDFEAEHAWDVFQAMTVFRRETQERSAQVLPGCIVAAHGREFRNGDTLTLEDVGGRSLFLRELARARALAIRTADELEKLAENRALEHVVAPGQSCTVPEGRPRFSRQRSALGGTPVAPHHFRTEGIPAHEVRDRMTGLQHTVAAVPPQDGSEPFETMRARGVIIPKQQLLAEWDKVKRELRDMPVLDVREHTPRRAELVVNS